MIDDQILNWELLKSFEGQLFHDSLSRKAYATDASIYRKLPLAVAYPKSTADIQALVNFASSEGIALIPRAAGTSLAGQCVGDGLVVDSSRHFTKILALNIKEQWVEVEPGVIRDDLNRQLADKGLFFGPNTSTSNRCMIGGMVGNNSCGSSSIKYGSTRDKLLGLEVILYDGSIAAIGSITPLSGNGEPVENNPLKEIENSIIDLLAPAEIQQAVADNFPDREVQRRNTGYAIDELLKQFPFQPSGNAFELTKLMAGSEGTLAFTTRIRLQLDPLPPKEEAIICAHFTSIDASLRAAVIAMESAPYACELMDKIILDLTKDNLAQAQNRFFVEGDPAAILAIELRDETAIGLETCISELIEKLRSANLGYAFPVVKPPQTQAVWRSARCGARLAQQYERRCQTGSLCGRHGCEAHRPSRLYL